MTQFCYINLFNSMTQFVCLFPQVTRSNRGGPNRMKKDSLAAIAVLLDDEEEGSLRSADSSSVVIANQRTTL